MRVSTRGGGTDHRLSGGAVPAQRWPFILTAGPPFRVLEGMLQEFTEIRLDSQEFPCEEVQIYKLSGKEAISQLFWFEIEIILTDGSELDIATALGADVALVFTREPTNQLIRQLHAMVVSADALLDTEATYRAYRLRLAPRAFRLTLIETQEIFLDQTIPQIIQQKLERVGLEPADFEFRLSGNYPSRAFVVQYGESDLAFVSRLAEHLGVSFHFEHDDGRDKIVFSDSNAGFRAIEGDAAVPFRQRGDERDVYKIELSHKLVPGRYVLQDFNDELPRLDLTSEVDLPTGYAGGVVEYGAHYLTPNEGKALVQIRAEERGATRQVYSGASDVCRFRVGARWTLEGHAWLGSQEMLLVEIEHRATQVVVIHGGTGAERTYTNKFRAIDAAVPYRPPRRTPRPRIAGLIYGLVEPEASGEIGKYAQIDAEGSYTVRFFFDTSAPGARVKSSLPIRMLQPHAGTNYGMHFPLKPGVEVLVGFVEGDPDRPFIVGASPNPVSPTPVMRSNAILNRIESATGILIEMKDV